MSNRRKLIREEIFIVLYMDDGFQMTGWLIYELNFWNTRYTVWAQILIG